MTKPPDSLPADIETITDWAEAARASFPAPFAGLAAEVRLIVDDWPTDNILDDLGMDDAYDLTGLYEGVPLTERSFDTPDQPSTVMLFRRPILDEWAARGDVDLRALVTHVTVHEFAHHFGWSDDDIARIDPWWL
ncbi:metallopeptidase family protein [Jannaschia sp. 2305UL9-9]|uniref:metallopeptidase family protein n=1 Tax=Jannaschia sp. 2305UL9-9 TaxID=3121638 RepID=UPI0035283603